MRKVRTLLATAIITLIATTGISTFAWADDTTPVAPNPASTAIPLSETVNAGDSVDLNGIEYTITVAPKAYENSADKGIGVYNGINVAGGSPIVVKPANGRSWTGSVTLADLFGAATNFGHAGLYEYTITQTHAGGSADDTGKWEYSEPEYMLQVLVQNDDETLVYTGWTLSKLNMDTSTYEKVNSGIADQNGAAAFSATYKATSTLNVTKKVDGAYANKQHPFEQTITLTLPDYAAKAVITAEGGSEGRWDPDPLPDVGETTRTYTVKLKHDDTVTFSDVPVGTRYRVVETTGTDGLAVDSANLKYSPKIDWDVDDGTPIIDPRSGSAYAVLDDQGKLTLFRSNETYTAGANKTVKDIEGNEYTGQVYVNIENQTGTTEVSAPWYNQRTSITSVEIPSGQIIAPTNCAGWFNKCNNTSFKSFSLPNLDTSNVTNMSSMFRSCSSLTELDVSKFDTKNVTTMNHMFGGVNSSGCTNLTSLDLSNFDTSNVTNMSGMFYFCNNLTSLNIASFDTSSVTDMSSMFYFCNNLTSLNIASFDTSKVSNMFNMFNSCNSLTTLDVSNLNTSNVMNMSGMFSNCSSISALDVTRFNTDKVTDMSFMFNGCRNLRSIDISNFNIGRVRDMSQMFILCSKLTTIFSSDDADWSTGNSATSTNMFYSCSNLKGGNNTSYDGSQTNKTYARIDKPGQPGYFTAKSSS